MPQRPLIRLAVLLCATACSEGSHEQPCLVFSGGGGYCLQATTAPGPFAVRQKIEAKLRGQQATMIAAIENDADALRVVGLTPFGQKLLQISYDNREISAATLPDRRLDPTLLVALLQITLWPADAVRAGLTTPLTLEEDGAQRRLLNAGQAILSIRFSTGPAAGRRMHLSVPALAMELEIETLPEDPHADPHESREPER
jgi:hypothetical protein